MFQLVFKGECTAGTDLATARANAGALFKASLEQVERMFSGQPVVIRNRLDEGQAEKYRLVLQKHGMVAYVETMAGTRPPEQEPAASPKPAPAAAATPRPTAPATQSASPERASAKAGGPAVEPGDRPRLAGEKVDDILAGSGLSLDPPGVTLVEHQETAPPLFQHLDSWTLAPAGSELGEKRETPPPVTPDISHLSLADEDQQSR
ncbi:hypothetical protein [Marinobacter sp.]|uniref:hypothetical protein n=1 Tax=Marinobacter sp. TaxID=50741 RepID=UPI003851188C